MKKYCALFIAVIMLTSCTNHSITTNKTATATTTTTPATTADTPLIDKIKFTFPDNWYVDSNDGTTKIYKDTENSTVAIIAEKLRENVNFDSYVEASKISYSGMFPDIVFQPIEKINPTTRVLEYTFSMEGTEITTLNGYFYKDGCVYTILCSIKATSFDSKKKEFLNIINSAII